jgi:hypothetical protein
VNLVDVREFGNTENGLSQNATAALLHFFNITPVLPIVLSTIIAGLVPNSRVIRRANGDK